MWILINMEIRIRIDIKTMIYKYNTIIFVKFEYYLVTQSLLAYLSTLLLANYAGSSDQSGSEKENDIYNRIISR